MTFLKTILSIIAVLFLLQPSLFSQSDPVKITIRVELSVPLKVDSVYISGNQDQLGNWWPDQILLYKISPQIWQNDFSFLPGTVIEFKITRGSWASEAMYTDNYSIPGNHVVKITSDTTIVIHVLNWKDDLRWSTAAGQLHTHPAITGFGLKPRDLYVWLPPDYNDRPDKRYPVIYMHDGQNMFDRQRAALNSEWRLDETADSLINLKKIESIIIVGIANTSDRGHEYVDSDSGRIYMKLVTEVIKPFIDRAYRTRRDRESTATGGSSAGGLISLMLLWEHPEIFSKAACLSPAFKIHHIDYVKKVQTSGQNNYSRLIYIDNGTIDLEALLQPGIDEMISALENRGLKKDLDYFLYIADGSVHNESAWARRTWRFLELFFPVENQQTGPDQN